MTTRKVSQESIRQTKIVLDEIHRITTRPWNIMEICGGQTHSIMEYGLDQLLPEKINLIHGPGCTVCVTSLELVERSLQIAAEPGVIFTSFGDMLRVPGSGSDLFDARAVAPMYGWFTLQWNRKLALQNRTNGVFFAVGFETAVPAIAASLLHAEKSVSKLLHPSANVLVPPAMQYCRALTTCQCVLAAGHVCLSWVTGNMNQLPQCIQRQCRDWFAP